MADRMISPPDGEWHYEYITPDLLQAERVNKVIYTGRTAYQSVTIQDTACFGRSLVLDSKTQSTELDEFVYHEALVQPCMIAHPGPREVFVAGGGEGATVREVFLHGSVDRAVMVDIDGEVVELCRRHLPNHHRGAFNDPRLELHFMDALRFLEETSQRFDVAIIDVPDPLEDGPAYLLYTQEFYELLKDRLKPGGMMVAQSGPTGPAFYQQCFAAVAKTVASAFPSVFAYETFVPSFGLNVGLRRGLAGPRPVGAVGGRGGPPDRRARRPRAPPLRRRDPPGHLFAAQVPADRHGQRGAGHNQGGAAVYAVGARFDTSE